MATFALTCPSHVRVDDEAAQDRGRARDEHGAAVAGTGRTRTGRTILIVQGSLIAGEALAEAFRGIGAQVHLTANVINAFSLLRRVRFDAAVIDQGLHNAAFELCSELQEAGIPSLLCIAPHRLQTAAGRKRDSIRVVRRIESLLARGAEARPGHLSVVHPSRDSRIGFRA